MPPVMINFNGKDVWTAWAAGECVVASGQHARVLVGYLLAFSAATSDGQKAALETSMLGSLSVLQRSPWLKC